MKLSWSTLSIIILLFLSSNAIAQNDSSYITTKKSKLNFTSSSIHKKSVSDYSIISDEKYAGLQFRETKATKRYKIYNQTTNNIDIYSATLKVNYDANGEVILYNDNVINGNFQIIDSTFPEEDLIPFSTNIKKELIIEATKVYFPISQYKLKPAIKVVYNYEGDNYMSIFDSEFNTLYSTALSFDKNIITQTAKASVFLPDPITSSGKTYDKNSEYAHNKGASNKSLEAEQFDVDIDCKVVGNTYYLENNYVKITDLSSPHWKIVTSDNGKFNFNRSQIGFQQVNAFYHISEIKKQIDAYGFTDAVDYQIRVDADAEDGDDNSHFNYGSIEKNSTIQYGAYYPEGSKYEEHIPDAEDGEVVVHEYTHAIINSYSTDRTSNERRCLEEAMADYIAVSYATDINDDRWQNIFKWDGHNEFWDGRMATSTKCYKDLRFFSNPYQHSDVWTAPLMDLFFELGKETTDKLVLHTITSLDANTTMEQAALIMLKMDTVYNNHVNSNAIFKTFKKYCILNDSHLANENNELSSFKVLNSQSFANGGSLTLDFGKLFSGRVTIYNTVGNEVFHKEIFNNRTIDINSSSFHAGIYLINISSDSFNYTTKVIKH